MQDNTSALPAVSTPKVPVSIGPKGIQITDLDGLWRFSQAVAKSGLAPKGIQTPEAVLIAVEMGLEVGLPPMAALQNIAVINGRPSLWGDAQLAVCRGTGELEEFNEWYEQSGKRIPRNPATFTDDTTAVCRVKRKGQEATETGFAVSDAKAAGLWGKEGPWKQYPARMLKFRARSFALRDGFGDALRGLRAAEEVMDDPIDAARDITPSRPIFKVPKAPTVTVSAESEQTGNPENPVDLGGNGSAPVEPVAQEVIPSLQQQLAQLVQEAGFTFDDWKAFAAKVGIIDNDPSNFSDVTDSAAKRCVSAKAGMLRALKGGAK